MKNKKIYKDRILIEPIKVEEKTQSGIILSATTVEKPNKGKVVLIGKEIEDIKIDDVVMFQSGAGVPVKIEEKDYLLLRELEILVVEEQ